MPLGEDRLMSVGGVTLQEMLPPGSSLSLDALFPVERGLCRLRRLNGGICSEIQD